MERKPLNLRLRWHFDKTDSGHDYFNYIVIQEQLKKKILNWHKREYKKYV